MSGPTSLRGPHRSGDVLLCVPIGIVGGLSPRPLRDPCVYREVLGETYVWGPNGRREEGAWVGSSSGEWGHPLSLYVPQALIDVPSRSPLVGSTASGTRARDARQIRQTSKAYDLSGPVNAIGHPMRQGLARGLPECLRVVDLIDDHGTVDASSRRSVRAARVVERGPTYGVRRRSCASWHSRRRDDEADALFVGLTLGEQLGLVKR